MCTIIYKGDHAHDQVANLSRPHRTRAIEEVYKSQRDPMYIGAEHMCPKLIPTRQYPQNDPKTIPKLFQNNPKLILEQSQNYPQMMMIMIMVMIMILITTDNLC